MVALPNNSEESFMKNKYIIIPTIIIVILGIITAFIFLTKDKSSTENNVAEVSIPVETSTPEPTPTPDPLPESSIDFKDIDPEIHATYNESTGEIIVDETMARTMLMDSPLFEERAMTDKYIKCELEFYLEGYYTGRFDGDAWYKFAATGDTTYLNFELSDEELVNQVEQRAESYLNSEEGQAEMANNENYQQSIEPVDTEKIYENMAKDLGITVEQVKALIAANPNNPNTSTGNTGGGSSQIATPSTDQSVANENTFVTPENNDNINNNSGSDARPGETTVDIWGNAAAAGDGGELITDIQINAN